MQCEVTFEESLPADVRAELESLIERYRHVLPAWLHTLAVQGVRSDDDDSDSDEVKIAEMAVSWEYGFARLYIYSDVWRASTPDYRDATVAHELLHAQMAPLDEFVDVVIRNLPQGPTTRMLRDLYEDVSESVTESVSRAFYLREKRADDHCRACRAHQKRAA